MKKNFAFLIVAVALLISCASTKPLSSDRVQIYRQLVEMSNNDLPTQIDELTVLEEVRFTESTRSIDYIYTVFLDNLTDDQLETFNALLEEVVRQNMTNNNSPAISMYRNDALNIRHIYYNEVGDELANILIKAGTY